MNTSADKSGSSCDVYHRTALMCRDVFQNKQNPETIIVNWQYTVCVKEPDGCVHTGSASGIESDESHTIHHCAAQRQATCSSCGAKSKLFHLNITHQEHHTIVRHRSKNGGETIVLQYEKSSKLISKRLGRLRRNNNLNTAKKLLLHLCFQPVQHANLSAENPLASFPSDCLN